MMIQQLSPLPHPLLHPHPLLPHRHSKIIIHRILQQELFPQESPQPLLHPLSHPQPLLLHPHPPLSSPHPQFVAAKSLMLNPPEFLYTHIICVDLKCVTASGENNTFSQKQPFVREKQLKGFVNQRNGKGKNWQFSQVDNNI